MQHVQPTILIVDDEEKTRKVLKINLQDRYRILLARNAPEAMNYLEQEPVHLVLTDLRMPESGGMELLKSIQQKHLNIPVIIITAYGSVQNAVEAMKSGAYDFIQKPINLEELERLLERSLRYGELLAENVQLKKRLEQFEGMPDIVSINPEIRSLLDLVRQVAPTDAAILIEGESGTGKALFARAVHYLSPRANGPFIELNCGAIPHDLLESELFGHERGAFTGAVSTKKGKFELAHHGTLFLDEIGELPLDLQVKLLHVLESQKFTRVGGTRFLETDARIVAATNRKLQEEVAAKRFREDLYYRLKVVYLRIPPLRERREDIPLLVNHFIEKHRARVKKKITGINEGALQLLMRYPWRGNVRELENTILQAMIFARGEQITPAALPDEIREYPGDDTDELPLTKKAFRKKKQQKAEKIISEMEYRFLTRLLKESKGNISEAARISGYDRRQLQNLLKKHRINPENFK